MALRVWLPLNGNLNNKGLSDIGQPVVSSWTEASGGKLGQCYKGYALYHLGNDFLQNTWTIAAWVKAENAWSQYNDMILCKNTSTSTDCQFYLSIVSGSKLNIGINLHNQQYEYAYNFAVDTWYHVAASFDGANYYLYLNGELVKTGVDTSTYTTPALNLTINGRSSSAEGQFTGNAKYVNDVRVYDECLSPKQIKEISKGLVCHYKLDNPYIAGVTNLAPGINNRTIVSINNSPTWDTTLNGNIIYTPTNWSNGYNTGVTDATHGYHAHWIFEDGKWIMMFPNLNSVINQKGRWLGISGGTSGAANILAGEKYTISWWQKTDNLNLAAHGGIYYKKTSSGTANFWDGNNTLGYNTKLNTWQFMSRVYTRSSDYVQHDAGGSIYVYGDNTTYEGTVYVKDVQVQKGEYTSPYTVGTQSLTEITDNSGNGYNLIKNGTLIFNTDSPRYEGSNTFNTSSTYLKLPTLTTSGFTNSFTVVYWAKIADMNGKMAWGFGNGNKLNIYPTGTTICCNTGDGANNPYQKDGSSIAYSQWNNEWHQFAMTADGTENKLYVDGEYQGTAKTYKGMTGTQLYLSGWIDSSNNYRWTNGSISDFRIYATALSADDILTLYKTSGIIDNEGNVYSYEFMEE